VAFTCERYRYELAAF